MPDKETMAGWVRRSAWLLPFGLLAIASNAFPHGVPVEDIEALERGGYAAYIGLGASHMLTGYDHLLFILGVVFFLTRFADIVKFITAFTVGHSITLLVGTLLGWKVNYYLIDAVIALTVCYKGLENIDGFKRYFDVSAPPLMLAVFIFGLIHGLGLSTRLQQLQLPEDNLVLHILSFNVGVELGQVAALAVMLIGLRLWQEHNSFARLSNVANKGLIAMGLLLFVFQLHGYAHLQFPDDLGFSRDLHAHAHEDLDAEELRSRHQDSLD